LNLFKIQNSGKTKLNKTKQKEKIKERERTYLASPVQPTRTGPAGPARHRYSPPCRLPLASGSSCVLARARPRRPPPPCLAASSFPGPSRDATQPRPPLTSPSLSGPPFPSLLCFPSRDRTEPPPPTRATVATGHPTAHRRPRKLRRSSLYLLNEPRGPGRATTPPSMPSSTSGPPAIFVKFAGSGPSPTSPSVPSSSP
jgi:hypothetical protein